ncbi:glucosamine-6-phosphate deaminase [Corynebacterium phocae]|uniref:Glucosamine-6-phosphate deaminase n=1 Tax=Corynebacterium phocae TaxID=161895 RepID=A0A1L7D2N4_9CORY|nr:glucosamine-6-phosphate deaminase [Corynebacterium phocae]APT92242.1 glucosamine-6-phosphate deaminase [Corynebacterium phocae]KAA8725383.1 glucosamine-6-phosphate deaminase [Corynebacterium phocae]
MEIVIRKDAQAVAKQAADIIEKYAREGAVLGLATGSSPIATYQELIRRHREEGLSFKDCSVFMLDEYVGLEPTHEQSYARTIRREFADHVDIEDSRVYSPAGVSEDPLQAARDYERKLAAHHVGIQLLGIGTNGHIGFNEPTSSLNSLTRLKTLHPQTIKDNARFFDTAEEVPTHVLTQGLASIRRAGHLLLVATGEGKAEAIRQTVEGPLSGMCPASCLQLHPHATILIDEDAASKLTFTEYYRYADDHKPENQDY